jgi:UDPglucose--hexose-1-phosphate uridylyltransferase
MANKKNIRFSSELRYDSLSKNWVVIATGRARRPETFKKEGRKEEKIPESKCPFCRLAAESEEPCLVFSQGKEIPLTSRGKIPGEWTAVSVKNKYPAFIPSSVLNERREGNFYKAMDAVGHHEVVVTRDHKKSMGLFSVKQIKEVIDVYHKRYLTLMEEPFVNYIAIFHNHGAEAGATISHPHSQIITTPLIDTDLRKAIANAREYYRKKNKYVYFQMNEWERKTKKRIIFENKDFLVFCPFASKSAFQTIISPKKPSSHFEKIKEKEKESLAEAFKAALYKLYRGLNDPPYNFYLHTAPCDKEDYGFYHWHWTILPKTSIWAGFELGAGMEISTIEPEKAAEYLRKQPLE